MSISPRIRSVLARLPEANSAREYEVYSPETQEVYVFNRFGQHIATKNILTGETSYTFQYNVNTSNGKLSMVVDSAGNRVFILRNYASQVRKPYYCFKTTFYVIRESVHVPDNLRANTVFLKAKELQREEELSIYSQ